MSTAFSQSIPRKTGDIKALRVLVVATISGVGIVLGALNIILQLIGG